MPRIEDLVNTNNNQTYIDINQLYAIDPYTNILSYINAQKEENKKKKKKEEEKPKKIPISPPSLQLDTSVLNDVFDPRKIAPLPPLSTENIADKITSQPRSIASFERSANIPQKKKKVQKDEKSERMPVYLAGDPFMPDLKPVFEQESTKQPPPEPIRVNRILEILQGHPDPIWGSEEHKKLLNMVTEFENLNQQGMTSPSKERTGYDWLNQPEVTFDDIKKGVAAGELMLKPTEYRKVEYYDRDEETGAIKKKWVDLPASYHVYPLLSREIDGKKYRVPGLKPIYYIDYKGNLKSVNESLFTRGIRSIGQSVFGDKWDQTVDFFKKGLTSALLPGMAVQEIQNTTPQNINVVAPKSLGDAILGLTTNAPYSFQKIVEPGGKPIDWGNYPVYTKTQPYQKEINENPYTWAGYGVLNPFTPLGQLDVIVSPSKNVPQFPPATPQLNIEYTPEELKRFQEKIKKDELYSNVFNVISMLPMGASRVLTGAMAMAFVAQPFATEPDRPLAHKIAEGALNFGLFYGVGRIGKGPALYRKGITAIPTSTFIGDVAKRLGAVGGIEVARELFHAKQIRDEDIWQTMEPYAYSLGAQLMFELFHIPHVIKGRSILKSQLPPELYKKYLSLVKDLKSKESPNKIIDRINNEFETLIQNETDPNERAALEAVYRGWTQARQKVTSEFLKEKTKPKPWAKKPEKITEPQESIPQETKGGAKQKDIVEDNIIENLINDYKYKQEPISVQPEEVVQPKQEKKPISKETETTVPIPSQEIPTEQKAPIETGVIQPTPKPPQEITVDQTTPSEGGPQKDLPLPSGEFVQPAEELKQQAIQGLPPQEFIPDGNIPTYGPFSNLYKRVFNANEFNTKLIEFNNKQIAKFLKEGDQGNAQFLKEINDTLGDYFLGNRSLQDVKNEILGRLIDKVKAERDAIIEKLKGPPLEQIQAKEPKEKPKEETVPLPPKEPSVTTEISPETTQSPKETTKGVEPTPLVAGEEIQPQQAEATTPPKQITKESEPVAAKPVKQKPEEEFDFKEEYIPVAKPQETTTKQKIQEKEQQQAPAQAKETIETKPKAQKTMQASEEIESKTPVEKKQKEPKTKPTPKETKVEPKQKGETTETAKPKEPKKVAEIPKEVYNDEIEKAKTPKEKIEITNRVSKQILQEATFNEDKTKAKPKIPIKINLGTGEYYVTEIEFRTDPIAGDRIVLHTINKDGKVEEKTLSPQLGGIGRNLINPLVAELKKANLNKPSEKSGTLYSSIIPGLPQAIEKASKLAKKKYQQWQEKRSIKKIIKENTKIVSKGEGELQSNIIPIPKIVYKRKLDPQIKKDIKSYLESKGVSEDGINQVLAKLTPKSPLYEFIDTKPDFTEEANRKKLFALTEADKTLDKDLKDKVFGMVADLYKLNSKDTKAIEEQVEKIRNFLEEQLLPFETVKSMTKELKKVLNKELGKSTITPEEKNALYDALWLNEGVKEAKEGKQKKEISQEGEPKGKKKTKKEEEKPEFVLPPEVLKEIREAGKASRLEMNKFSGEPEIVLKHGDEYNPHINNLNVGRVRQIVDEVLQENYPKLSTYIEKGREISNLIRSKNQGELEKVKPILMEISKRVTKESIEKFKNKFIDKYGIEDPKDIQFLNELTDAFLKYKHRGQKITGELWSWFESKTPTNVLKSFSQKGYNIINIAEKYGPKSPEILNNFWLEINKEKPLMIKPEELLTNQTFYDLLENQARFYQNIRSWAQMEVEIPESFPQNARKYLSELIKKGYTDPELILAKIKEAYPKIPEESYPSLNSILSMIYVEVPRETRLEVNQYLHSLLEQGYKSPAYIQRMLREAFPNLPGHYLPPMDYIETVRDLYYFEVPRRSPNPLYMTTLVNLARQHIQENRYANSPIMILKNLFGENYSSDILNKYGRFIDQEIGAKSAFNPEKSIVRELLKGFVPKEMEISRYLDLAKMDLDYHTAGLKNILEFNSLNPEGQLKYLFEEVIKTKDKNKLVQAIVPDIINELVYSPKFENLKRDMTDFEAVRQLFKSLRERNADFLKLLGEAQKANEIIKKRISSKKAISTKDTDVINSYEEDITTLADAIYEFNQKFDTYLEFTDIESKKLKIPEPEKILEELKWDKLNKLPEQEKIIIIGDKIEELRATLAELGPKSPNTRKAFEAIGRLKEKLFGDYDKRGVQRELHALNTLIKNIPQGAYKKKSFNLSDNFEGEGVKIYNLPNKAKKNLFEFLDTYLNLLNSTNTEKFKTLRDRLIEIDPETKEPKIKRDEFLKTDLKEIRDAIEEEYKIKTVVYEALGDVGNPLFPHLAAQEKIVETLDKFPRFIEEVSAILGKYFKKGHTLKDFFGEEAPFPNIGEDIVEKIQNKFNEYFGDFNVYEFVDSAKHLPDLTREILEKTSNTFQTMAEFFHTRKTHKLGIDQELYEEIKNAVSEEMLINDNIRRNYLGSVLFEGWGVDEAYWRLKRINPEYNREMFKEDLEVLDPLIKNLDKIEEEGDLPSLILTMPEAYQEGLQQIKTQILKDFGYPVEAKTPEEAEKFLEGEAMLQSLIDQNIDIIGKLAVEAQKKNDIESFKQNIGKILKLQYEALKSESQKTEPTTTDPQKFIDDIENNMLQIHPTTFLPVIGIAAQYILPDDKKELKDMILLGTLGGFAASWGYRFYKRMRNKPFEIGEHGFNYNILNSPVVENARKTFGANFDAINKVIEHVSEVHKAANKVTGAPISIQARRKNPLMKWVYDRFKQVEEHSNTKHFEISNKATQFLKKFTDDELGVLSKVAIKVQRAMYDIRRKEKLGKIVFSDRPEAFEQRIKEEGLIVLPRNSRGQIKEQLIERYLKEEIIKNNLPYRNAKNLNEYVQKLKEAMQEYRDIQKELTLWHYRNEAAKKLGIPQNEQENAFKQYEEQLEKLKKNHENEMSNIRLSYKIKKQDYDKEIKSIIQSINSLLTKIAPEGVKLTMNTRKIKALTKKGISFEKVLDSVLFKEVMASKLQKVEDYKKVKLLLKVLDDKLKDMAKFYSEHKDKLKAEKQRWKAESKALREIQRVLNQETIDKYLDRSENVVFWNNLWDRTFGDWGTKIESYQHLDGNPIKPEDEFNAKTKIVFYDKSETLSRQKGLEFLESEGYEKHPLYNDIWVLRDSKGEIKDVVRMVHFNRKVMDYLKVNVNRAVEDLRTYYYAIAQTYQKAFHRPLDMGGKPASAPLPEELMKKIKNLVDVLSNSDAEALLSEAGINVKDFMKLAEIALSPENTIQPQESTLVSLLKILRASEGVIPPLRYRDYIGYETSDNLAKESSLFKYALLKQIDDLRSNSMQNGIIAYIKGKLEPFILDYKLTNTPFANYIAELKKDLLHTPADMYQKGLIDINNKVFDYQRLTNSLSSLAFFPVFFVNLGAAYRNMKYFGLANFTNMTMKNNVLNTVVDWLKGAPQGGLDFARYVVNRLNKKGKDIPIISNDPLKQQVFQRLYKSGVFTQSVLDALSTSTGAMSWKDLIRTPIPKSEIAKLALFKYGFMLQRASETFNKMLSFEIRYNALRRQGIDDPNELVSEIVKGIGEDVGFYQLHDLGQLTRFFNKHPLTSVFLHMMKPAIIQNYNYLEVFRVPYIYLKERIKQEPNPTYDTKEFLNSLQSVLALGTLTILFSGIQGAPLVGDIMKLIDDTADLITKKDQKFDPTGMDKVIAKAKQFCYDNIGMDPNTFDKYFLAMKYGVDSYLTGRNLSINNLIGPYVQPFLLDYYKRLGEDLTKAISGKEDAIDVFLPSGIKRIKDYIKTISHGDILIKGKFFDIESGRPIDLRYYLFGILGNDMLDQEVKYLENKGMYNFLTKPGRERFLEDVFKRIIQGRGSTRLRERMKEEITQIDPELEKTQRVYVEALRIYKSKYADYVYDSKETIKERVKDKDSKILDVYKQVKEIEEFYGQSKNFDAFIERIMDNVANYYQSIALDEAFELIYGIPVGFKDRINFQFDLEDIKESQRGYKFAIQKLLSGRDFKKEEELQEQIKDIFEEEGNE